MGQKQRQQGRGTNKGAGKAEKKVKDQKRRLKIASALTDGAQRKKDPGVPDLGSFKDAMLDKFHKQKEIEEQIRQNQKSARADAMKQKRQLDPLKAKNEEETTVFTVDASTDQKELQRRKWYVKEMKKVIETADVILEVLDARDPLGCKCPEVETMIQRHMNPDGSQSKRIVLVLNKTDLVPPAAVEQWVKYLKREFPTVAFKASTQKQKGNLGSTADRYGASEAEDKDALSGSIGASSLLELLKNYSRTLHLKKGLTVGVVGFPNVGKSSVINSLKRSRAVGVGSQPGFTRALQTIKLDKTISIIDSPGVLFSSGAGDADLVLRNCLRVEQLENPEAAVGMIIDKVPAERLMEIYEIGNYNSVDQFLFLIATRRGYLQNGGRPHMELAARKVISDWNESKIPFYALPPDGEVDPATVSLVGQFSEAFDVNALLDGGNAGAISELQTLRDKPVVYAAVESSGGLKMLTEEDAAAMDAADGEDDDADEDGSDIGEGMSDEESASAGSVAAKAAARLRKQQQQQQQAQASKKPTAQFAVASLDSGIGKLSKSQKASRAASRAASRMASRPMSRPASDDEEEPVDDSGPQPEFLSMGGHKSKQQKKVASKMAAAARRRRASVFLDADDAERKSRFTQAFSSGADNPDAFRFASPLE